jgi:hypothetical protein
MTMMLTDEAREIVLHFTSHMPPGARARYEAKVREMLKQRHGEVHLTSQREDDEAIQATHVCTTVMAMLWDEAKRRFGSVVTASPKPSGGQ